MSKSTIGEILKQAINSLNNNHINDARIDSELLLMHILKYNRAKLLTELKTEVPDDIVKAYMSKIEERIKGKPVQYIIGSQEFMGLEFIVNENVLIPRQDTEILVETVLNIIKENNIHNIMDIGTGTGCIPISICSYAKAIKAIGVDISTKALMVAQQNAKLNRVEEKIEWIHSDLFTNIPREYDKKIDILISNPPYIPTKDINELMTEVKDFEPIMALDGGISGLDFYKKIIAKASKYLMDKAYIIFEIGYNQGEDVKKILLENNYNDVKIIKDYVGHDRVVFGKYAR